MPVHNHGPDEGLGKDCPEEKVPGGALKGLCLRQRSALDQNFLSNIGQLYRECREEEGMTQRESAVKANTTSAWVSYLENGKKDIQILSLQNYARTFGYQIEFNLIPLEEETNHHVEDRKEYMPHNET